VSRVTFSPDGRNVVVWSDAGKITNWDLATGELVHEHVSSKTIVDIVSFLQHGRSRALLKDDQARFYVWDFASQKDPLQVPAPPGFGFFQDVPQANDTERFALIAVSPDGTTLAGGSAGSPDRKRMIRLWKLEQGKSLTELESLRDLPREMGEIKWLRFTADGSKLIVICRNENQPNDNPPRKTHAVYVWEVATGRPLQYFACSDVVSQGTNRAAAMSPQGSILAIGSSDKSMHIYDLTTGKSLGQIKCLDVLHSLAFSADGKWLVSGGRSRIVRLWNVATRKEEKKFRGHRSWIESVAISPDGRTIVSGAQDSTVRLWDIQSGKQLHATQGHQYLPFAVTMSRDGKLVVSGGGSICFWQADTGKLIKKIANPNKFVVSLALSPNGEFLAVGSNGNASTLRLIDVQSGNEIRSFASHNEIGFNSLSFSHDGTWLLAGEARQNKVRLWEVATGKQIRQLSLEEEVVCVAISPDDKTIATAEKTRQAGSSFIRLWNADTGRQLNLIASNKGSVNSLAFSPNGKLLVSGGWSTSRGFATGDERDLSSLGWSDSVQLWDIELGQVVKTYTGEPFGANGGTRIVNHVTFSPDGRFIVTSERGASVNVYETETGNRRATLQHRGEVRGVSFSADGRRMASISQDLTALIWDFPAVLVGDK
jgi:WD40 repeat protein